jgi:hypothetical protein
MATNFPNSLDAFTNPTASDTLASVPHASQHADANDAIEALEAKVGINSATSTSTLEVRAPSIVTSSTRPTGVSGRLIYETDTKRHMVYVDGSEQWQPLAPRTGYKNAIINGDFRINQREFSSTTTAGYGFDHWRSIFSGGTVTYSSQSFITGVGPSTGYEPSTYARLVSASQTGVNDFAKLRQPIENVRTFSGSKATISFWARAGSGTPKVAIELNQYFGTGGAPSSEVNIYAGQITLSTSWVRYSVSIDVPSLATKVIGTNANTSCLFLDFWTSAGSTYNSRTGSLGLQNVTVDFWGVQMERGSIATDLEERPINVELQLCQRYYQRWKTGYVIMPTIAVGATNVNRGNFWLPVSMRDTPNTSISGAQAEGHHTNAPTITSVTPQMVYLDYTGANYRGGGISLIYTFLAFESEF